MNGNWGGIILLSLSMGSSWGMIKPYYLPKPPWYITHAALQKLKRSFHASRVPTHTVSYHPKDDIDWYISESKLWPATTWQQCYPLLAQLCTDDPHKLCAAWLALYEKTYKQPLNAAQKKQFKRLEYHVIKKHHEYIQKLSHPACPPSFDTITS